MAQDDANPVNRRWCNST